MRTSGPGNYDKKFIDVQVQVFVDDKMNQALSKSDVCDRKQYSSVSRTVPITQGQWSSPMYGRLTQRLRPHVWFFAIDRCSIPATQSYFNVEYEVEFLQEDGSHFSMEQRGALFWTFMHFLLVASVTAFVIHREMKVLQSGEKLHVVLQFLNVVLLVNLSALAGRVVHYWFYSNNGQGIVIFDVIGNVFATIAEITLTSLIMLMGLGFTFTVDHVRGLKRQARYVLGATCLMHLILSFISRLGKDERYQYSELEGVTGWILASVRYAITAWHIYNCVMTARNSSPKQALFIHRFCLASTLYLAVFPSLYIISELFIAQYNRLRFVTHIGFIAQFACIAWFAFLFTGRKSEYFQVSTLSGSYLPASFVGQVLDINWMTDSPHYDRSKSLNVSSPTVSTPPANQGFGMHAMGSSPPSGANFGSYRQSIGGYSDPYNNNNNNNINVNNNEINNGHQVQHHAPQSFSDPYTQQQPSFEPHQQQQQHFGYRHSASTQQAGFGAAPVGHKYD